METSQQEKKITLSHVFAWIFGIIFLLGGIGTMTSNLLGGILIVIASLLILPPAYEVIKEKAKINLTKGVRILIAVALLGIGTIFINPDGYKEAYVEPLADKKEEARKEKERVTISAIALHKEFEANGVATEEKYKDKILVVNGIIGSIDRDILDSPFVTLQSDNPYITAVQCMFAEKDVSVISTLTKGQSVTVEGELAGDLFHPLLRNCKVTQ